LALILIPIVGAIALDSYQEYFLAPKSATYTDFLKHLERKDVAEIEIDKFYQGQNHKALIIYKLRDGSLH